MYLASRRRGSVNGWYTIRSGSKAYDVALYFLLPANHLKSRKNVYVNIRALVMLYGYKAVNHSIKELNSRYNMGIQKAKAAQYNRRGVWELTNPGHVTLSPTELLAGRS